MAEEKSDQKEVRNAVDNPYLISLGPVVDVSGWEPQQLREYQRLMEHDRDVAERCYESATEQATSLMAATAVVLSIIVSGLVASGSFWNPAVALSLLFMTASICISGYAAMKTMSIISIYRYDVPPIARSGNLEEMIAGSVKMALMIEKAHADANNRKRKMIDCSLILFMIGIVLLAAGMLYPMFVRSGRSDGYNPAGEDSGGTDSESPIRPGIPMHNPGSTPDRSYEILIGYFARVLQWHLSAVCWCSIGAVRFKF